MQLRSWRSAAHRRRTRLVLGLSLLGVALAPIHGAGWPATGPALAAPDAQSRTSPTEVSRAAVQALLIRYYQPLDPALLFTDAWEGATAALRRAGVADVPPAPAYPSDLDAAVALHRQSFPAIEQLAEGKVSARQLTDAAVGFLASRRGDCHTYYIPPGRSAADDLTAPGAAFADREPEPIALGPLAAPPAQRAPVLEEHRILPGNVGLIRIPGFVDTPEQSDRIKAALTDFEAQGVVGWIFDVRNNPGGSQYRALPSLFVASGRLYGYISRQDPVEYINATGRTLPFQRPLAILINHHSYSAAEFFAGGLWANGRATLVGEQSGGCIGSTEPYPLADGSRFWITWAEGVIGPEDLHLHKIGLTPDVSVAPSGEGDAQLDAAVRAVLEQAGS